MSEHDELVRELEVRGPFGPYFGGEVSRAIRAIQSLQARVKELEADAGRWRKFIESKKFERNIPEWCKD